jgi:peptide/nickel transport system ATP-binding protein
MDALVQLSDVTKRYDHDGAAAVAHVSLAVAPGEAVAVMGPSGSGKSTLLNLIAGLDRPTSGTIVVGGERVDALSETGLARFRRRHVGMIFQFFNLLDDMTVADNILLPAQLAGLPAARARDRADELMAALRITPHADAYPARLSGGERQRVAIARALAVQPDVLLADEPVSMLDVSIRLGVLNLLADLRETSQLAILYVTHDIASARYLADTIVVMYAGELVESAPSTELTDAPAHPYTQLLLSAAPDPARAEPPMLAGAGAPPSLVSPPSGCRFHPRCPHAMTVCREQRPPMVTVSPGHSAACWLHVSDLRPTQAQPVPGADPSRPGRPHEPAGPAKED